MENIPVIQEMGKVLVAYQGVQLSLPEQQIMASLPEIVRREILGPKLCDRQAGYLDREQTAARIVTMLGVNFVDDEDRKIAMTEFRTFLREWNLTKDEVLEAYRMALKKELQKDCTDLKGNITGSVPIQVFPNLSLIQAGEILNAYIEYKISSAEHSRGKEELKKLMGITKDPPPIQVDREKYLAAVFDDLKETKRCFAAWTLYDELAAAGRIEIADDVKVRLFNRLRGRHVGEMVTERMRFGKTKKVAELDVMAMFGKNDINTIIKRKCQSIAVCNYLKKHLADFETFKLAVYGQVE